jgi:hypothetical protein
MENFTFHLCINNPNIMHTFALQMPHQKLNLLFKHIQFLLGILPEATTENMHKCNIQSIFLVDIWRKEVCIAFGYFLFPVCYGL